MAQSLTQIRCPNCSNPVQAEITQLIDIAHDPGAKARLLSGSNNHVQCGVCGYQGQVATPIVYHDPDNELLLTYIPVELGMPKDEQEKILGRLTNQAIDRLEQDQRKGYLLQPQAVLTIQGLVERILEADGITKEEIESQREKLRLFEDLLRSPDENVEAFVEQNDEKLDAAFFQLASLSLQATPEGPALEAANSRLQLALAESSYGKEIIDRESEIRLASESLQNLGDQITHDTLLDLFIEAPNETRLNALVQLTRPALDYIFFQRLTERIDAAQGEDIESLTSLRQNILEITQEIDQVQEERANRAAGLIGQLLEAEDLDNAIKEILPQIDELLLSILQANIRAAQERGDEAGAARLLEVDTKIKDVIRGALPPSLQLAQKILELEDISEAKALLDDSADQIDENLTGALLSTAQRLEDGGDAESAEQIRDLHRYALRLSMKQKMKGNGN
jgi:hypothetical protein